MKQREKLVAPALAGLLGLAMVVSVSAIELDGLAARVGTESIMRSEILQELSRAHLDQSKYDSVRNDIIDRKLILKAASESKMTMQEWVIENRIREIIEKSFEGDRNKLMDMLSRQKVSYPEWRAKMKEDMIVSAMRWNVIDKNVVASPAEMKHEYETHPERYREVGKVTVSVILLKPEDKALRSVVSEELKTKSFAEIAKARSADSHAAEGGVWKDVVPDDVFRKETCDEIAKMPKGTLSHWIEIDGWSYLLRKDDETSRRDLTFEDAYDEIEENVRMDKADKAYKAWVERLRAETYIKLY